MRICFDRYAHIHPEGAIISGLKWENGRNLRVRFLDGQISVQDQVFIWATEWCNYANIKFIRSNDINAEIRISFNGLGAWSYIGKDALNIPNYLPTMNLGFYDQGTVLHEFGHALGMIHEHQNPAGGIPWNVSKVYQYYSGPPNNWTKEMIDRNILNKYSVSITQFTQLDPKSIMMYWIDPALTDGQFTTPYNFTLSNMDKDFIAQQYPGVYVPLIEQNQRVIENIKKIVAIPPVPPILYCYLEGLTDFNGDGYADPVVIVAMSIRTQKRKFTRIFRIIFDGLSTSGGAFSMTYVDV